MERLLGYLASHRGRATAAAGAYFVLVVLMHDQVSHVSVWIQKKLTIATYNSMLTGIGISFLAAFLVYMAEKLRRSDDRLVKVSFLALTVVLMLVSYRTLLVINAEFIHFLQYALLAIPLFAILRGYGETLFWVTLLGAVDEAYQYFVLYPSYNYFDFNDVILNLIGGAAGIVSIYAVSEDARPARPSSKPGPKASPALVASVLIVIIFTALYLVGELKAYPDGGAQPLVLLSRVAPQGGFWIKHAWGNTYHVLTPLEGISLSVLLMGLYWTIDLRTGRSRGRVTDH